MRKCEIGKMLTTPKFICLSKGEKGDPQIQITQTWIDKNRYPFDYSKPIKLQEFPLRNKDINSEGTNGLITRLSFLSRERGDVGNLYGLPTREKFGNLRQISRFYTK